MRIALSTVLVLVFLAPSVVVASVWTPADDYLTLRRQTGALTGKAAAEAITNLDASRGKTVELKGTISGIVQRSDSSAFFLNSGGQSYIIASSDPDPQVDPGCAVRMLVKVGAPNASADYVLVATAWDYVITTREKQASARLQKRASAPRRMTSRGGYQRPDVLVAKWTQILEPYKKAIMSFNRKLTAAQAEAIACYILEYSEKYDVDPRLVVAVVLAESHFRLTATSRSGAMGLGQLMPGTAAGLGVSNPYDPHQNLSASVRLIRGHLDKLSGGRKWSQLTWDHLFLALASYNAGPGAVRRYGGVPPYRETRTYIARVTQIYKQLCGYK
ncbi:MAG: lytic transglycosylase domain-containing protein [Armatimonadota bacterium]|nr:lytic transglycosylase domain-containing protein [Armatimonadota bacterium]